MSKNEKLARSYIIRNCRTERLWQTRNGKKQWASPRDAKLAWHLAYDYKHQTLSRIFDEQSEWVIVELGTPTTTALKLLAEAQTIIKTYAPRHIILLAEIEQFLAANK